MMAWILSLWANPLARKIILYGAALLAAAYGFRLWLNKHDSRIEQQTRIKVSVEIKDAKQTEWKAKEAAIAADAVTVATEKAYVKAATEQLTKDRADLSRSLNDAVSALQRERTNQYANVANIPASDLDSAIRAELRAADK